MCEALPGMREGGGEGSPELLVLAAEPRKTAPQTLPRPFPQPCNQAEKRRKKNQPEGRHQAL